MSAEYRLRVTKWRKFVVRVRLIEGVRPNLGAIYRKYWKKISGPKLLSA